MRTLLASLVRTRRAVRALVRRLRVQVRRLAHPSARLVSDGGGRRAYPTDLVGGQLQGLKVGAQRHEIDPRAGRREPLLLEEEEQLLVRRGRMLRGRAVQGGGRCGARCATGR
ncbi:hypothetical protein [Streptomyces coeruleorubidus]|uniref:hypothetical protein n=1 Tax=Streptomyces coeruleorubidus TaxID=116188 RepID=UPI0037B24B03